MRWQIGQLRCMGLEDPKLAQHLDLWRGPVLVLRQLLYQYATSLPPLLSSHRLHPLTGLTACSNQGNGETCQNSIFSVEGSSSGISVYNLNTVGSISMIDVNGNSLARFSDNVNVFPDTVALFRN